MRSNRTHLLVCMQQQACGVRPGRGWLLSGQGHGGGGSLIIMFSTHYSSDTYTVPMGVIGGCLPLTDSRTFLGLLVKTLNWCF